MASNLNDLVIYDALVIHDRKIEEADLLVKEGFIKKVENLDELKDATGLRSIKASNKYISPGFIDLQINGAKGRNFIKSDPEEVQNVAEFWISKGTTGFLSTIITGPISTIHQAAEAVSNAKSKNLLGIHIEGPFISVEKRGAHYPSHILTPSEKHIDKLFRICKNRIKMLTLAPELPNIFQLIERLVETKIILSIGHSNATYEQAMSALNKGAKSFTHLFNAMSGFHHRRPGCVGAALDSDAYVGLICDGLHVHPAGIRLALKAKGIDKICLVTDAISAAGMGDGKYTLGDQTVIVKEGVARLPDGTLAGSTLTMNQAVKNFMEFTGVSLPEAVRAASLNPAKLLGIEDRKGSIEEGKDADLVIFDQDFNVHYTIIGGEIVYSRED